MTYIAYSLSGENFDGTERFEKVHDEAAAREKLKLWINQMGDMDFDGMEPAYFSDAFFKVHSEPTEYDLDRWAEEAGLESRDEWTVQAPGTHPGGKAWWVTPCANIFVAVAHPKDDE